MSSLKEKTVKGVVWSSIDRFTSQGISFVFSMLIARMLMPSDYGVVAMLGIFMAVSGCFIDSGFGTALVRKIDRTETDFSTVFYFNNVQWSDYEQADFASTSCSYAGNASFR